MKNFDKFLDNENQDQINPFLYATPEVEQKIRTMHQRLTVKLIGSYLFTNFIIAPLQTIATSLQLSVVKHKGMYESKQAKSKLLTTLNTQLTLHEKKKMQLVIRTGGQTPYVAPVYGSYTQTIKGLFAQGYRAFYKGIFYRSIHNVLHLMPYTYLNIMISKKEMEETPGWNLLTIYAMKVALDVCGNMFQVLENRRILQNHIFQFQVYRHFLKDFRRMFYHQQVFVGWRFHLINNFFSVLTKFPFFLNLIYSQTLSKEAIGVYLFGQTFMYPITTAYRRVLCQTTRLPGMIPHRYSGVYHALKVILFEEGIQGLYRGYGIFVLSLMVRMQILKSLFSKSQRKEQ